MDEKLEQLLDLYAEIKREVKKKDPYLYERWKAGGFLVDDDIYSNYPNIQEVVESLAEDDEECDHPNAVYYCPDCQENFID